MKSSDEKKLKVLHITPWYPNPDNAFEAMWIKRHIQSVATYADQFVLHIDISEGNPQKSKRLKTTLGEQLLLKIPTKKWFIFELAWFFILFYTLIVKGLSGKVDIIQFHISYPSLTYWHWLKPFIKTPVLIIEHWSAYHFNFGIKESNKLKRIKRIFSHKIPVVCVSKSLLEDIRTFSGYRNFDSYILPNVVDTDVFFPEQKMYAVSSTELLMVSQWNWPKEPRIIVSAFARWNAGHNGKYSLKIAGYGNLMPMIEEMIIGHGLKDTVKILGKLSPAQIASEMRRSLGFLHCSAYETFSVVCAEALSCGTPVIASNVGGIREFIDENNGVLVAENSIETWCFALEELINKKFNSPIIAKEAQGKFSDFQIGFEYFQILKHVSSGISS